MSKQTSRIPELFGSCVFNEETMAQAVKACVILQHLTPASISVKSKTTTKKETFE